MVNFIQAVSEESFISLQRHLLSLLNAKKYIEVLNITSEALTKITTVKAKAFLLLFKGVSPFQQQNPEFALKAFQEAETIQNTRFSCVLYLWKGKVCAHTGRLSEALEAYKKSSQACIAQLEIQPEERDSLIKILIESAEQALYIFKNTQDTSEQHFANLLQTYNNVIQAGCTQYGEQNPFSLTAEEGFPNSLSPTSSYYIKACLHSHTGQHEDALNKIAEGIQHVSNFAEMKRLVYLQKYVQMEKEK